MKKLSLLTVIALSIASCSDDKSFGPPLDQTISVTLTPAEREELQTKFGKALVRGLAENPSLRSLIKNEALKMFNNDYDVLYHLIKDTRLKGGLTVRQLLITYLEDEQQLVEIENHVPLLTIFVPSLPEETFSASLWNIEKDIPSVAITDYETNEVKIFDHEGDELRLQPDEVPGFPVVVIKENERVVTGTSEARKDARGRAFRTGEGPEFVFLGDCFDASIKVNSDNSRIYTSAEDPKLINAYNIYNGTDGWQRDYIYYNITPTQTRGPFSYDYAEHIRSFVMSGGSVGPAGAYSYIAQTTGDPTLKPYTTSTAQNAGWTGGFFEFKVRVLLNARNAVGSEFIQYFGAYPTSLFNLTYQRIFPGIYKPIVTDAYYMPLSLPLFPWDLENYSATVKIEIEEVDVPQTVVISEQVSAEFANNFEFDIGFGEEVKVGMKFGASSKTTGTQTVTRTYTTGNNPLGSAIVNFADKVIVSQSTPAPGVTWWNTRQYTMGYCSFSMEPKRVQ